MQIGLSADKSFAYLLGVYLGDGCVTRANPRSEKLCFRLNTIDADFAEATKAALENWATRPVSISKHSVKKSTKPNHSLYCGDDIFSRGLMHLTAAKQKIPMYLWDGDASREEKLEFIAGLMDSEGFVAANKNPTNRRYYMGYKSCDPWVPEFIKILESVGIRIGKVQTEKPLKPGYKAPMRFTIKMQSWVDSGARFNIARKQNRVDEWASAPPYTRRARYPRRLISETNTPDAP